MTTPFAAILELSDAGQHPAQIAAALPVSLGHVYATLREHRPDRPRKQRRATSDLPRMVRGLDAQGITVERIAVLLAITPAYVYRILSTSNTESKTPHGET